MLSLTDNHINWFPQNTQNTDRGSLQNRKISPNPRGRSRKNKINLRLVFSDTYGDVRSAIGPRAGMRLAKLRLEETGEDVDHRTNTTVSRPRQFRVALRIVVIPRGWLRLSRGRHCCRSKQGRTAGASSIGQRRPDVARVFVRAVSALVPAPSSVQPNCQAEDRLLAAVFALLLRAAVEVPSTGARGPSHKKRVANAAPDSMTRANERSSASEPNKGEKTESSTTLKGPYHRPTTVSEKQKSPNPYIFCRKLQWALPDH